VVLPQIHFKVEVFDQVAVSNLPRFVPAWGIVVLPDCGDFDFILRNIDALAVALC
jgi:hypothetical protein